MKPGGAKIKQKIEQAILDHEKESSGRSKPASVSVDRTVLKVAPAETKPILEFIHEGKLLFKGSFNDYYVLGTLPMDLATMNLTIQVAEPHTDKRNRYKLDLYEYTQVQTIIKQIADYFYVKAELVQQDVTLLTDLVEKYRDELVIKEQANNPRISKPRQAVKPIKEREAIEFLSQLDLMNRLDTLIEQAGIPGQEQIRTMLIMACGSYKGTEPLHIALSGSKTQARLIMDVLAKCLPADDIFKLDDADARTVYHYTNGELKDKILLLPDALGKKPMQALNRLQQESSFSASKTGKDKRANVVHDLKLIESHFSSVMYTGENTDPGTSTMAVPLIQGSNQENLVLDYLNKKQAGLIDEDAETCARELSGNIIRCLNRLEVVNPYAGKIVLPGSPDRLKVNSQFQWLVKVVCLFHQFQRSRDEKGRLIAQPQDLLIACDMLFNSMPKDDMDRALHSFYQKAVDYVKAKSPENPGKFNFTMKDLREGYCISKTSCFRFIQDLMKLKYVERISDAKRGFAYRIIFFEDKSQPNSKKQAMTEQINALSVPERSKTAWNARLHATTGVEPIVPRKVKCVGSKPKTPNSAKKQTITKTSENSKK